MFEFSNFSPFAYAQNQIKMLLNPKDDLQIKGSQTK